MEYRQSVHTVVGTPLQIGINSTDWWFSVPIDDHRDSPLLDVKDTFLLRGISYGVPLPTFWATLVRVTSRAVDQVKERGLPTVTVNPCKRGKYWSILDHSWTLYSLNGSHNVAPAVGSTTKYGPLLHVLRCFTDIIQECTPACRIALVRKTRKSLPDCKPHPTYSKGKPPFRPV